ncbi:hypothetical protein [Legionella sp. CNM-4043-24]|uniref:hypothetical protein n=1 Tax=Legionella sp. CNM-4043-24 TaxID=3421646 RepID=UPI00403AB7BC
MIVSRIVFVTGREHMEHFHDDEISRLRALLRHAGEFIAYFELAEAKMLAWRQDIEQQQQAQEQAVNRQLEQLRVELQDLQTVLTEAGIARLCVFSEDALKQSEAHLAALKSTGNQLIASMAAQQQEFSQLASQKLQDLQFDSAQVAAQLDKKLSGYDAEQFRRIAEETCEQVERIANDSLKSSVGLLRHFQWRASALALVTTFFTALAIGLYISNESPWEIHKNAINERLAGKALLKAWPNLSQQERNRIMQKNG